MAKLVGANPTDLECLDLLGLGGPTTAGRLAAHTGLTTGAMTAVIDRLERAGFARRLRNTEDRRSVLVEALPDRLRQIEAFYQPLAVAVARLNEEYGDRQLAVDRRLPVARGHTSRRAPRLAADAAATGVGGAGAPAATPARAPHARPAPGISGHAGMTRLTAPGPFVRAAASQQSAPASSSRRTEPAMPNRRGMFLRAVGAVCLLALTSVPAYAQTPPPAVPAGPLTLEQVLTLAEPRSEAVVDRTGRHPPRRRRAGSRAQRWLAAALRVGELRPGARLRVRGRLRLRSGTDVSAVRAEPDRPRSTRASPKSNGPSTAARLAAAASSAAVRPATSGDLNDLPFGRKNTWRAFFCRSRRTCIQAAAIGAQKEVAALGHESAGQALTTARGAAAVRGRRRRTTTRCSASGWSTIAAATLEQAGATLKQTQAGFDAGTQPEFEVLRARVSRDNQSPVLIRQRANRARRAPASEAAARTARRLSIGAGRRALPTSRCRHRRCSPSASSRSRRRSRDAEAANAISEANVDAARPHRRRRSGDDGPSARGGAEAGRSAEEAERVAELELWPHRVSRQRAADIRSGQLDGGRQHDRADSDRRPAARRRSGGARRAGTGQVAAAAGRGAGGARHALGVGRTGGRARGVGSDGGTVQQAQRAYQIANVRFTNGVSTQLELSDARLSLQQAEANRAQAARDLQVARARVALLPDLPVSAPSGSGVVPPRVPQPQSPSVPAPRSRRAAVRFRNASAQGAQPQVGLQ